MLLYLDIQSILTARCAEVGVLFIHELIRTVHYLNRQCDQMGIVDRGCFLFMSSRHLWCSTFYGRRCSAKLIRHHWESADSSAVVKHRNTFNELPKLISLQALCSFAVCSHNSVQMPFVFNLLATNNTLLCCWRLQPARGITVYVVERKHFLMISAEFVEVLFVYIDTSKSASSQEYKG